MEKNNWYNWNRAAQYLLLTCAIVSVIGQFMQLIMNKLHLDLDFDIYIAIDSVRWLITNGIGVAFFYLFGEKIRREWKLSWVLWGACYVMTFIALIYFGTRIVALFLDYEELSGWYDNIQYFGLVTSFSMLVLAIASWLSDKVPGYFKNGFIWVIPGTLTWMVIGILNLATAYVWYKDDSMREVWEVVIASNGFLEAVGFFFWYHAFYCENLKMKMGLSDQN